MQPHATSQHGGAVALVASGPPNYQPLTSAVGHSHPGSHPGGSLTGHPYGMGNSLTGHPYGMGNSLTGHPQSLGGSLTNYPHSLSSSLTAHPHTQSPGSSFGTLPQTMGSSQTANPHVSPPAYPFSVFHHGASAVTQPPSLNASTSIGASILGGSASVNNNSSSGNSVFSLDGYSIVGPAGSSMSGKAAFPGGVVGSSQPPQANITPVEPPLPAAFMPRHPQYLNAQQPHAPNQQQQQQPPHGPNHSALYGNYGAGFQTLPPGMQLNMPPLALPAGSPPPGGTYVLAPNGGVMQYVGASSSMQQAVSAASLGSIILPSSFYPTTTSPQAAVNQQAQLLQALTPNQAQALSSSGLVSLQPREPHPLAGAPLIQSGPSDRPLPASGNTASNIASKEALNESKVYVRHLSQDITLDTLRSFFGQFGTITSVSMHRERGGTGHCAYLTYDGVQAATDAIRQANGSTFFQDLASRMRRPQQGLPPLSVRMAESLTERNDRWARRAASASTPSQVGAPNGGAAQANSGSPTSSILLAPHSPNVPPMVPLHAVPPVPSSAVQGATSYSQHSAPASPGSPSIQYFLMLDSNGRVLASPQ